MSCNQNELRGMFLIINYFLTIFWEINLKELKNIIYI